MRRAARHRKRTAPPGPCGVLWQTQRGRASRSRGDDRPGATGDEESAPVGEEENESLGILPNGDERDRTRGFGRTLPEKKKKKGNPDGGDDRDRDASTPPAWTAMQRSLGIVTPYLPARTLGDVPKRCELLRPHLPPYCLLLSDVLRGEHDLRVEDPDLYLCAWVDSIDERNAHHGIWTVVLKDETGATIRAWMEPNFCKTELQKAQQQQQQQHQRQPQPQQDAIDPEHALPSASNTGVVRTGVVWMLRNFSLTAIHHPNGNSNRSREREHDRNGGVERMLVVSGKRIARVWTPEKDRAQNEPNEEDDSPEAQRGYLDWMEKRKALAVEDEEEDEDGDGDGDGEDEEEDEEGEGDDRSTRDEYCENNTVDHGPSEMDERDEPGEERRDRGNVFSAGHQHLARSDSRRCKAVGKSPSRIEKQRKNDGSVDGNGGCGDDREYQRGNQRIVGGTPNQERMTAMSALTMTTNEDMTQATQNNTTANSNNYNNNVAASVHTRAVPGSPPETQPLSPLAHRDANVEEESNNYACADAVLAASARNRPESPNPNNARRTRNRDDGGEPSLPRLARKSAKGRREQIPETSDPDQPDTEIATQPGFAKRNKIDETHTNPGHNETNNHRKEERRKMIAQSGSDRTANSERTKHEKDRFRQNDDASPCGAVNERQQQQQHGQDGPDAAARNPKKTKGSNGLVRDKSIFPPRNRGDRGPIRSPVRLPRSLWNAPDPSILEMLREEEEAIETRNEEDEAKTLLRESFCPSCSCLASKTQLDGAEVARTEESKTNGFDRSEITPDRHGRVNFEKNDYCRGNESPIAEQLLLSVGTGGALFQPSSWVGVDMAAFSEEEMDDES